MGAHARQVLRSLAVLLVTALAVVGLSAPSHAVGSISGTVTEAGGGGPLPGICVTLFKLNLIAPPGTWEDVDSTHTLEDPAGSYSFPGLADGTYRVGFENCETQAHTPQYWNNKPTFDEATNITVSGNSPVADAVLVPRGMLEGTVTNQADGEAIEGVDVSLYAFTNGAWDTVGLPADLTDENGYYSFFADPGTYRVGFATTGPGEWTGEFYSNEPTVEAADDVIVEAATTHDPVDAALGRNGLVPGDVVDVNPQGLPGVTVTFFAQSGGVWLPVDEATTDGDGHFERYLPPGTYRALFDGSADGYALEYWNDKPTIESADDIVVTAGVEHADVDAELVLPGTVTGTVTSTVTDQPINDVQVTLFRKNPDGFTPAFSQFATLQTGEDGVYTMEVPPGTYRIQYERTGFGTLYYAAASTLDTATDVEVQTVIETVVDMALVPAITAVTAPSISGTAKVGSTLTATAGSWEPTPTTTSYQWRVGGVPVAGATANTYVPVAADLGKTVRVTVTVSKVGYVDGSTTSAATAPVVAADAVPLAVSATAIKAKVKGTKVKLKVTVTSSVAVTGQVKIFRKKKLLKTVTLSGGKATVKLKKQPKGKGKYKASYLGSTTVLPSSKSVKVVV